MQTNRLIEITSYFLRLGFLGFGGPLALMSAFQKDLVHKRKWIDEEHFNRALALIKALPGPAATQLSIYLGRHHGGRLGGFIAGLCIILPAFFMMLGLGAFYETAAELSWTRPILFGMQAAALGVILDSIWRLAKPYKKRNVFWIVAVFAAVVTSFKPSYEPLVILGSGLLGVALARGLPTLPLSGAFFAVAPGAMSIPMATGIWAQLFGVFFKAGAFVFGTGLAIVPLLAHDVVEKYHWLTNAQFMDALAFGQVTPGPVVITATFVGYKVAGVLGAVWATTCIFAPAFFNMLTWFPWFERHVSKLQAARTFVLWAVAAVVGSIAVAVIKLMIAHPMLDAFSTTQSHIAFGFLLMIAFALSLWNKFPVWIVIPSAGLLAWLLVTLQLGHKTLG